MTNLNKSKKYLFSVIIVLVIAFFLCTESLKAQWSEVGGPNSLAANSGIFTSCMDNAGNIYVAGDFTQGTYSYTAKKYVAKWDGNSWTELGGLNSLGANGLIYSICTDKLGNVYAAGAFTNGSDRLSGNNYVAKWDGISWTELGGVNALGKKGTILSICSDTNGNIYAAGNLKNTSGFYYVAEYHSNGGVWGEAGTAVPLEANNIIRSVFCDSSNNIYSAGYFDDGTNCFVGKEKGNFWTKSGGDMGFAKNGPIYSVYVDNKGQIYAAGNFINSSKHSYVAKYDGNVWSELGGDNSLAANGLIYSVYVDSLGNVYAGGYFTNGINSNKGNTYVAKWDGVSWSELGGVKSLAGDDIIRSIFSDGSGHIYATGDFWNANKHSYVAKYTIPTSCIPTKDTITVFATGSYKWHGTTYTAGTTTATFDTINAAGCDSLTTLHLTIIPTTNTWIGKNSTDWNDPANWSSGILPDSSQDIIITNVTNKPINNGIITARNVIIDSGASLTNNGTLSVYGNFTDSGRFESSNSSKVVLKGTGIVSGSDTFANLEIHGDYTVNDSIAVTQRLIKTSGSLNTSNRLTLISNAAGTALIEDDGGSLVGKVTVQHFAGGSFGYHHFATPVSGTTVNDWSHAFPIFGPDGEPAWLSNRGSLQIYNEPANKTELLDSSYYNYTNLSNELVPGQGYSAWLNSLPTLKTLGIPNNGAIAIPVTITDTANATTQGWNLVGNPYPSPISWSALYNKNASILGDKSCYLWKADGSGTSGTWETFNGSVGTNGAGDIINSSLGFFVYVKQSGNLDFDNSVRNYNYTSPEIFGTKSNATTLRLSIKAPNANTTDEAVAYTSHQASFSRKMPQPATATNPTIAFDVKGTKAAINVLTAIDSKTELTITVMTPKAGTYTLSLNTKNIDLPVYLKDAVTGTYTELSGITTITTTSKETSGRYSLVFSKPEQLSVNSKQLTVFPNPSKDKVTVSGNHIASVQVVDNLGRVVKTVSLKDATNPTLNVCGLSAGAYHLRVQTSDGKVNGANLVVSDK